MKFDDFDVGPQSDENIPPDFWDRYEVDCDDGTEGDKILVPKS